MVVWIADFIAVANDGFVIGDSDNVAAGLPQPLTAAPSAFDGCDRYLGRPLSEFTLPIGDERFGANQQNSPQLTLMGQEPNGGNSLHRLSQTHLIGQHGPMS